MDWLLIMAPGTSSDPIRAEMLPADISQGAPALLNFDPTADVMALPLREARDLFETQYLQAQLLRFGGNISRTAGFVGDGTQCAAPQVEATRHQLGRPGVGVALAPLQTSIAIVGSAGACRPAPACYDPKAAGRATPGGVNLPMHTCKDNKKDQVVANEKPQNVQDVFLNHVRKGKTPVTVFLINGVKLQGIITWFDNFSVLLRRGRAYSTGVQARDQHRDAGPPRSSCSTPPKSPRKWPLGRLLLAPTPVETAAAPQRAAVILPWERAERSEATRAAEARLAEAIGLAASIGLVIVHSAVLPLRARRPSTLLGEGQVANAGEALSAERVDVAIVDAQLSPVQQRNLERAWDCKVIDRTGLILDIFGERARTREGSLQVELAHLDYQRSRLVRSWTHLERQRGGFGFLGGPGETQIEADRRLIGDRIVRLKQELEQVRRTRGLHRQARRRVPYPVVALVGYTNAGKSTLFNALTGAEVVARDQLFATLDPTMRGIILPSGRKAILSDTVGFVSDLPTELIEAFRATLEEVAEADVILHVRDAAHPDTVAQRADVVAVLDGMAKEGTLRPDWPDRTIEVLNKADLLGGVSEVAPRDGAIVVSAMTGEGLDALGRGIDHRIATDMEEVRYSLRADEGARLAWLYEHGEVLDRNDQGLAIDIKVRLRPADRDRFERER